MTFLTEILSTETSGFLKQMIILKSFNSVFKIDFHILTQTPNADEK